MKFSSYIWWSLTKEITMSVLKTQDQGTIVLDQQDYLAILIQSFLIDRRAQGLSPETISFYKSRKFYRICDLKKLELGLL
jgi:hypothetical protein